MLDLLLLSSFNQVKAAPSTSANQSSKKTSLAPKPEKATEDKTDFIAKNIFSEALKSLGEALTDFGSNAPGGGATLIIIPQY